MFLEVALALLLGVQERTPPQINEPYRLTTSPAEDYMPAVSPDGAFLAFVSDRAGAPNIWIKSLRGVHVPTPRRLTNTTSGDKRPVFSPDASAIVYVSYGSDAEGDLYRIALPEPSKIATFKPAPERLTDITAADKEPVFTPDGRFVIYTSADKRGGAENLWRLDLKTKQKTQLTRDGGQSPAVSPDGATVVFVSRRGGARGRLYRLDLDSGREQALTSGGNIDSFPAFIDGDRVVFVRYADDTNLDSAISIEDRASLYVMDIDRPGAPAVPLTSVERYNLFPAVHGGFVYYTAKQENAVDLYRIPVSGAVPASGSLGADMEMARAVARYYPDRPALPLLAWRVAWAANADDRDRAGLAECLMNQAMILRRQGALKEAATVLSLLIRKYPNQRAVAGAAMVERAIINARRMGHTPDRLIDALETILGRYEDVRSVAARTHIEIGAAQALAGQPSEALKRFRLVVSGFSDLRALAAEAAFKRNEIYDMLGNDAKRLATYLDVIRTYPDQLEWRDRAVERILDMAVAGDDLKASAVNLGKVAESYGDLPFLQAAAMIRLAGLYYDANETLRARDVYARAAERWRDQKRERNRALLALASIYAEEEDFAKALEIYSSIERDTSAKREVFEDARREYIRQSLKKADYELAQGDARVAVKTYRSLIDYDHTITEAHRGLLRAYATLGESKKAARRYGEAARDNPGDAVYQYSYGLALTYLEPLDLDRAETLIKKAIAIDDRNPWFRQTLGWVYEQKERLQSDEGYAEFALQEYQYALALKDTDTGAEQQADLLLNLGNIHYLLRNYADARANYKARHDINARFTDRRIEALYYHRWGECEYKLGDDRAAVALLAKALSLTDDRDIARRIELLERMGLSYQSAGEWERAVDRFARALTLRRQAGDVYGEPVALRNIANNLYFLSQASSGGAGEARLREALRYYRESETAIDQPRKKPKKKAKSGLTPFLVEIETGVGGVKGASRGFTETEERKLIFHHIGRIYGELKDYAKAVAYFEKKLDMTPPRLPLLDNVPVLTEKAIILNQIGYYLAQLGKPDEAIRRFDESLELCLELDNASGLLINTDNMAKLALGMGGKLPDELLGRIVERGSNALEAAAGTELIDDELSGAAANHLGQLYHLRLTRRATTPEPGGVRGAVAAIKSAGDDAYQAERFYTRAVERFAQVRSIEAARASLGSNMNLALLKADMGLPGEAVALLERVAARADDLAIADLSWQARYLIYRVDPAGHAPSLAGAAGAIERTPFGYGLTDNPRFVSAMIRTMYADIAERAIAKDDSLAAAAAVEKALSATMRLGLAGLVDTVTDIDAVAGLSGLADRWRRRQLITELAVGMAPASDRLKPEDKKSITGRRTAWEKDYDAFLDELAGVNPLLAWIARPDDFNPDVVRASLEEGEAAIAFWPMGEGYAAVVVTPAGYAIQQAPAGKDLSTALDETVGMIGARRVYLVTSRPFSDPAAMAPSGRYQVAAIPSFGYLYHLKERLTINDFKLLAVGFDDPALEKALAPSFMETVFVSGEKAREAVRDGALAAAGVTVFASAPIPATRAPQALFSLGEENGAPHWIPMERILRARADAAVLATPPVSPGRGGHWESAMQTLALMAGYPTWIVTPEAPGKRKAFLKAFAKGVREESIGAGFDRALKKTGRDSGRLLGSVGLSGEERTEFARSHFAGHIRKGMAAVRANDLSSASVHLKQALAYTTTAGVTKYDALVLNALAEVEVKQKRFEPALVFQERLNALYKDSGQSEKLADSLLLTGVIEARLRRYRDAVDHLGAALDLYREAGLTWKMADAWSKIGVAEERDTSYGRALEAYSAALEIESRAGEKVKAAVELGRIGRIHHLRLNQFGKARDAYRKALKTLEGSGETRATVRLLIELGAVEEDAGNLDRAETIFKDALLQAKGDDDTEAISLAQFHLANVNWFRGAYDPALSWIRKSLKKSDGAGDARMTSIALNTQGLIYWTLNDYRRAMDFLGRALTLARDAGSKLDEASTLNNIGLVHRRRGDLKRSVDYFSRARAIDEELKSDWGVAYDARNMSVSLLRMGSVEKARALATEAVRLTEKIGDRVNHAKALLQSAEVSAAKGEWDAAMDMFVKAQTAARSVGGNETLWRALRGVGRASVAKGDVKAAVEAYKRAVEVVERMRAALKIEELKSGFLDDKQDLYEELIQLLLDRNAVREAFIYSERARARGFIDLLGATKITLKDKVSQEMYDNILDLKRRLDELSKAAASAKAGDETAKENRRVAAALSAAIERVRIENPGLIPFVTVDPIDPARLKRLLGGGVTFVEYVVAKNEVIAFVVTSDGIEAVRTPVERGELARMVHRFRKLLQDGAPLGVESRQLSRILVDPVMGRIKNASVVGIIPHRVLHYVSFAALRDDRGYLIEKKPLFYLPAASVFEFTVQRRTDTPKQRMRALAVGNPDLGGLNTDLPLSELEAQSIQWSFPSVDILLRGDATETNTLKNVGQYQILHIASHGEFDPVNPLRSSLRLARDTHNDGALEAKEVFSLNLAADIVIMSACQTGLGKVTNGDEVVGLNRAFLYSGAHSIVSTLWRVDDLASALLMKHFYREFTTANKAEALRRAQLTIKRQFPHPSFWAGFTLVGDYQ